MHDPATLTMAFARVAGNQGARTPGVDGLTVVEVEERIGTPGFLHDLRAALKDGSFRPFPVRERKIPKPGGSGKVRSLGINGGNPPNAPKEALLGMWLLLGGAVVTGGGLLALGWHIPGIVQLVVLGVGAGLLTSLAAGE
ncbi:hypothetical protein [Streptomyces sp. LBL]|uniref:hypothetical protein n=1 Tax=Streptomyces sp. LBL TaxID=2940562 RepID=UPI002473A5EA|nr:hypothetical protein [Streptomyces sp. LBL]